MTVTTVINFCSNDSRFIIANVIEALKFSEKVIIPVCDHFNDGTPENRVLLNTIYSKLNSISKDKIEILEYEWTYGVPSRYWHNMSRWLSIHSCTTDYVLFLDADEIVLGSLMKSFIKHKIPETNCDIYSFDCYWYYREPIYQATSLEQAAVMFKTSILDEDLMFSEQERWAFRNVPAGTYKISEHTNHDNTPFVYHYSWVRTKEQMLKKVATWGHNKDKDWKALVESEFSHEFNGTDILHGYTYQTVPAAFNI